jgi:hypothetical protein
VRKRDQQKASLRQKKQELAMTALRKIRIEEETLVAVRAPVAKLYVIAKAPAEAAVAAPETAGGKVKNIALFLAAPFIGLAYIVALPLVGFGLLTVLAVRAAAKFAAVRTAAVALKHIGMLVAAPFIGLAYVVFFPVICLGLLVWTGGRALVGASMR